MKTFTGIRPLDEIKKLIAERKDWAINTNRYDEVGSDFVLIKFPDGDCMLNIFNGHFFGTYKEERFDHTDASLDDEIWFNKLLLTFYTREEPVAAAS